MKYLLFIIALPFAVAVVGYLYQLVGGSRDRRRFAAEGRWVNIGNGSKHYLLEKGEGAPSVLFEAGIAATNLNWYHIQEEISRLTFTASYDRGGLGWSSPTRTARTPNNIAMELHALTNGADIKPPFILVGHSFGGLVMRRFALLYPELVAGVILVDPMRCEEWPPLAPAKQAALDKGVKLSGFAIPIARFGLARLAVTSLLCRSGRISGFFAGAAGDGGRHVLQRVTSEVGKMPKQVWPVVAAHWSRPGYYDGMRRHVESVPDTVREMHNAPPIEGIPVLLLTPGQSSPLDADQLCAIGDNVVQVIAEESAHWIHLDEPELVIDSIREMVETVRVQAAMATA